MIIFNGYDFTNDLRITNIDRSILPPISIISKPIVGKAGSVFQKRKIESAVFAADFIIIQDSLTNLRAKARFLAAKFNTETPQKLYFKDEPDKYVYAIITDTTELEETLAIGRGTIKFFVPEPIYYGATKTQNIISGTTYTNAGTYKTEGILTITLSANVSFLNVTLLETGEFIYLEDSFISGDVIVIDFENEKVTKNGTLIMNKLYLTSDFFAIPVGSFRITFNAGTASLTYVERWL